MATEARVKRARKTLSKEHVYITNNHRGGRRGGYRGGGYRGRGGRANTW